MTKEELCQRYGIPPKILEEYESWGLCGAVKMTMAEWQFNDSDVERLGLVMALHDIGFASGEVEDYMRLFLRGDDSGEERLQMLERLRSHTLEEIHLRERQLERVDYLRYEMRRSLKDKEKEKI